MAFHLLTGAIDVAPILLKTVRCVYCHGVSFYALQFQCYDVLLNIDDIEKKALAQPLEEQ